MQNRPEETEEDSFGSELGSLGRETSCGFLVKEPGSLLHRWTGREKPSNGQSELKRTKSPVLGKSIIIFNSSRFHGKVQGKVQMFLKRRGKVLLHFDIEMHIDEANRRAGLTRYSHRPAPLVLAKSIGKSLWGRWPNLIGKARGPQRCELWLRLSQSWATSLAPTARLSLGPPAASTCCSHALQPSPLRALACPSFKAGKREGACAYTPSTWRLLELPGSSKPWRAALGLIGSGGGKGRCDPPAALCNVNTNDGSAHGPLPVKDLGRVTSNGKPSSLASEGSHKKRKKLSVPYLSQEKRHVCPTSTVSFIRSICQWTWPFGLIAWGASANDHASVFLILVPSWLSVYGLHRNRRGVAGGAYPISHRESAKLGKLVKEAFWTPSSDWSLLLITKPRGTTSFFSPSLPRWNFLADTIRHGIKVAKKNLLWWLVQALWR